ncbi:Hypothetical predicted protein [Lecanosticta acicola]|uniref:SnoaL-like domain-containing protein n=1 Tax=Lecanosticta acicola TaxID=111012 RepID=A0AAI8YTD7_9PEZI|nr:Hypothetical predicted protein [Lecanosticta acicola]
MAYPLHLTGLTPKEAVADALYRACNSYDTQDLALHDSAFVNSPESFVSLDDTVMRGFESIRMVFHMVAPLDTSHMATTPRVQIHEGGKTAHMTATILSQHFKAGEGKEPTPGVERAFLTGGALYDLDLELDETDALWKIKHFRIKALWRQGDAKAVGLGM